MRRFRGRAATDDEAPPTATGTSEAAGDAANETRPAGDRPVPENGTGGDPATAVISANAAPDEPDAPATGSGTATTRAPGEDATAVRRTGAHAGAGAGDPTGVSTTDEPEVPGRDLPAGVDLDDLRDAPPGSAGRGKLRRRIRYLRHVRELLLRDLGGFYVEAHRSEQGPDAHRRLLDAKARRIATLDAELRELEERLADPHAETVVREPGIGGTCPECGELFGTGARFCSRCAHPLTGRAARERIAASSQSTGTTGSTTGAGTTGAGTIGPATGAAAEEERMTTASLWGRRRTTAPAEPSEETRAADLTQPARSGEAAEPVTSGDGVDREGDPATRSDGLAQEEEPAGSETAGPADPSRDTSDTSDRGGTSDRAPRERPGDEPSTEGRA